MIDIHSHLLPGVDDGSQSIETSVAVLTRFAAEGVETLVCTPHLKASQIDSAPYEHHVLLLEQLRAAAPAVPRLELGWEIMLDRPGADLSAPTLSLARSSAVLVEFSHSGVPSRAIDELARLRSLGVVPVLAHPERYWGCTIPLVQEWRSIGVVMQLDGAALTGSGRMTQFAMRMLEEGLIDCIASDNHGDKRSLGTVSAWFREIGAESHAELMTRTNTQRLLQNQPVLPVPPLPPLGTRLSRRALRRLKTLLPFSS